MSKDKFNWKGLFINEEGQKNETNTQNTDIPKENKATSNNQFPDAGITSNPSVQDLDNNVLDKVLEMYENGFDSLNKPGYDFYEYFKAVKAVNSNDPSIYKMAFSMAQGVDSKINKSTLLEQAQFYINEIEKVHKDYKNQGVSKRSTILTGEKNRKTALTNEISELEKQILQLQTDLSKKQNELASIDNGMISKTSEIDQTIMANDLAKETILNNIKTVVEGIKTNI